jgi:CubicO group peptidase (beta-lactamase class C family)
VIDSISIQFVAAVILQLADEKKLSIDDKVARWFPELTRASDITLHDLMTHVSGYRDNYPLDFVDEEMKKPISPDASIRRYATLPLDFEPRTQFSYSSTGYKILGRVLERVTGKALGEVLRERVFAPLGMSHTSYLPAADAAGVATGYTSFALGPPEAASREGDGWLFGSSGIHAPAGDVARWNLALADGKVLSPGAFATFRAPQHLSDGRVSMYGCGVYVSTKGGEELLQHSGRDAGFSGWSALLPRTRSSVVVLSNRDDVSPVDLGMEIVALLNKSHRAAPLKVDGPPTVDAARDVFASMQSGHVDRARLGDDFNVFLTDVRLADFASRLGPLGAPREVRVEWLQERGGMESTSLRLTFATTTLTALMFRSRDGKVQQFLVAKP